MDRDSAAAARTEASDDAPSLSQTALHANASTSYGSENIYRSHLGSSNAYQASNTNPASYSTPTSSSPQVLETPTAFHQTSTPAFWSSNAFELAANEAMSRHRSQGGGIADQANKPASQYQLMSSESPADQARSLSQVSPGFIFVIFPLYCPCSLFPSLLPHLFYLPCHFPQALAILSTYARVFPHHFGAHTT